MCARPWFCCCFSSRRRHTMSKRDWSSDVCSSDRRGVPLPAPRSPEVVDGLGSGYGHPTPEGETAARLASQHGLILDPTYGAKAFAFLLQRATCNVRRVVFWHTFAV